MFPAFAALSLFNAAKSFLGGIKGRSEPKPVVPAQGQANHSSVRGINTANAPHFAEVLGKESAVLRAEPMARTIAQRIVKISHGGLRTEKMHQLIQLSRLAFLSLVNGGDAESAPVNDLRNFLAAEVGMKSNDIDDLLTQLTALAKAGPDVHDRFIKTRGASLSIGSL